MTNTNQINLGKKINKLLEVVSDLRDPINGCPWDLKQTHLSLIPYVLEEAYEVAHAIREENPNELKEELGDLLLQIILHAQIAKEKNLFDMGDIIDIITEKLIRRHPHVFQKKATVSIKEVEDYWEQIKNNEKPLNNSKNPISDRLKLKIRPQPSTNAAVIISKRASKIGFEWEKIDQIWDKLYEELEELKDALKKEDTSEAEGEIGDVLFTLINIARWNKLSIEEGLARTNKRFIERLTYIEKNIDGELHSQSKKKLEQYWELAKINLKH
ncbi:nucleoside triphosphate pyrophosphohydrolase [Prochlorococcus marinus]|uniref:nucleoside triphosphate pyrophosphohydrolase n=1 Tax=Prochlorococcus marinus TaxID=1219 RepID=UPI0022B45A57|nr:nucleoside triphosphate pyrophosphohydrolase [Prochlorococcus marinus]